MEDVVRQLLEELGEDPDREGLRDTPKRVAKALKFLTSGYDANIDEVLNGALFTVDYNEMVISSLVSFVWTGSIVCTPSLNGVRDIFDRHVRLSKDKNRERKECVPFSGRIWIPSKAVEVVGKMLI